MLEEAKASQRTYYLRVRTSGAMTVPLVAWSMKQFVEHQYLEWALLCVFYGAVLAMTCYNAFLFVLTRERQQLHFAMSVLSVGFMQLTVAGHTFQILLYDQPELAQRAVPLSIGLTVFFTILFGRYYLPDDEFPDWYKRLQESLIRFALGTTLVGTLSPHLLGLKLTVVGCVLISIASFALQLRALFHVRGIRQMVLAWACLIVGALVLCLTTWGVLPSNALTNWSLQIGAIAQFLLMASGLAGRLNRVRAEVASVNIELSEKVASLEAAVALANDATERAGRAARVKDVFMATMSHELRTPLNAIINLPQGLAEDFPVASHIVCAACNAAFQLEPGESLSENTPCPECHVEALSSKEVARYVGRPERTTRYLEKIERAGLHLLQVVNGILDVGKMKSGYLALSPEDVEIPALVEEVVEEMADLAERSGVSLSFKNASAGTSLTVDRLRVRQVLINLIGNAIKFSAGRGSVTVSVESSREGCLFAVKDEGIGIAAENFETIFRSFEQVQGRGQRKFAGTGLGLFISRTMVRQHGGELWVESSLGHGATFRFNLPRNALPAAPQRGHRVTARSVDTPGSQAR
jgi:signal transduction histidine kinase